MSSALQSQRVQKLAIHVGGGQSARVREMLARQNTASMAMAQRIVPGGAIGCVGSTGLPTEGDLLLHAGIPINGTPVSAEQPLAAKVAVLTSQDGAFVSVLWDEAAGKLVLVTDFLGLQPLYMRREPGMLELASETKAFAARPNAAGWGAFIAMGHTIGEQTLLEGLQRVPAAALLVYDVATDQLDITRYWHWPRDSRTTLSTRAVGDALCSSIEAYTVGNAPAQLLLSGGFDSRLLLYALREVGQEPEALTVAHEDELQDADGTLARLLARRERLPHRFVKPARDFFSSGEFLNYVEASDAAIPTMDLFIAKVVGQIDSPAVWDGLVPGFALRLLFKPGMSLSDYVQSRCHAWDSRPWRAARLVFGEAYACHCHEQFKIVLREQMAALPGGSAGATEFIVENRLRHRTSSNPIKVFGNRTLPFLPGMTREFIALLAGLSTQVDEPYAFYFALFRERFPRALDLPIIMGGNMVRTRGRRDLYWKYRALDRINTFLGLHPRVDVRRLWRTGAMQTSPFLADDALLEDSQWIDTDAAARLPADDPLYVPVRRLLFHWKTWQWVHEDRLRAMLPARI